MAYRHAWELVDDLNRCFREPVTSAATGGRSGGGALLTDFGRELIARFHAIEEEARAATSKNLAFLRNRGAP